MILSSQEYARLKRRDRRAVSVRNLSDAEIEAILSAEPPPEAAEFEHEWPAACDAKS